MSIAQLERPSTVAKPPFRAATLELPPESAGSKASSMVPHHALVLRKQGEYFSSL